MASPSRIDLRWLCLVLATLALLAYVNGLRAARDRHHMLLPSRAGEVIRLPRPDPLEVDAAQTNQLLLALPADALAARLALYQIFPERRLLRWMEMPGEREPTLVLPLRGLDPGDYRLMMVDAEDQAAPQEMDQPVQDLPVLLAFRLFSGATPAGD